MNELQIALREIQIDLAGDELERVVFKEINGSEPNYRKGMQDAKRIILSLKGMEYMDLITTFCEFEGQNVETQFQMLPGLLAMAGKLKISPVGKKDIPVIVKAWLDRQTTRPFTSEKDLLDRCKGDTGVGSSSVLRKLLEDEELTAWRYADREVVLQSVEVTGSYEDQISDKELEEAFLKTWEYMGADNQEVLLDAFRKAPYETKLAIVEK